MCRTFKNLAYNKGTNSPVERLYPRAFGDN